MPELNDLLPMLVLIALIGGFAGVLAGLLGVGGGIVLVPAFFYALQSLGYDGPQLMQICLATSLATIIVTSARSVHAHNKKGAVDWEILRTWAPGIMTLILIWLGTSPRAAPRRQVTALWLLCLREEAPTTIMSI